VGLENGLVGLENGLVQGTSERALALADEATNNTDMKRLDQQVKSMMRFSENANPYKSTGERARVCKVCGKEGDCTVIKNHIEANHIAGISIPCGLCGKVCKTRNLLKVHKYRHHGNQ